MSTDIISQNFVFFTRTTKYVFVDAPTRSRSTPLLHALSTTHGTLLKYPRPHGQVGRAARFLKRFLTLAHSWSHGQDDTQNADSWNGSTGERDRGRSGRSKQTRADHARALSTSGSPPP